MLKNNNRTLLQSVDPKDIKKTSWFTDIVVYALPVVKRIFLLPIGKVSGVVEDWKVAMDQEMDSLFRIFTCELVNLLKGKKAIDANL